MTRYDEFKLSIDENNNITYKLKTPSSEKRGKDKLVTEGVMFDFINRHVQKLKKNEDIDGEYLIEFGEMLYEAIFPKKIGEQFEEALSDVYESQLRGEKDVQIRLIIDADPNSIPARWPLEFLRCKKVLGGKWLATERDLIALSRRLILETIFPPEPAYSPIQVLVIVSKPNKLGGVMAVPTLREIAAMTSALNTGPATRAKMEVKVLGMSDKDKKVEGLSYFDKPATYAYLQELTVEEKWYPHVLHFIGHGDFDSTSGGSLGLVDRKNEVDWCSSEEFADIFTKWRPRLVLLQACESAKDETGAGFMSLAAHLVKHNIPAVVAMQFAIQNDYATDFAKGFYKALQEGKDFDTAVQWGRWKIANKTRSKDKQFGAPVLIQYDPSGIFVAPAKRSSSKKWTPDRGVFSPETKTPKKLVEDDGLTFNKFEGGETETAESYVRKHLKFSLTKIVEDQDLEVANIEMSSAIRKLMAIDPDLAKNLENAVQDDDPFYKVDIIKMVLKRLAKIDIPSTTEKSTRPMISPIEAQPAKRISPN